MEPDTDSLYIQMYIAISGSMRAAFSFLVRPLRRMALAGLFLYAGVALAAGPERPLTVFAAASLTDVLQAVGSDFAATGAPLPRFSFAASSALARQIEAGAQADVFFSADQEWMDYLAARDLVRAGTRRDLVGNRLVLVARADSPLELAIGQGFTLAQALGPRGRLAVGDPDFVPAGRYARSALTSLGVWNQVVDRLARADNVRVALAYVARGETPLGVVYASDAQADARVRVVGAFPSASHPPITYPVAAIRGAAPGAEAFIAFLAGPVAAARFAAAGFTPVAGD